MIFNYRDVRKLSDLEGVGVDMVDQELYEVEKKRLRIKELARKMEKKRKVGIKELAAFAGLVLHVGQH